MDEEKCITQSFGYLGFGLLGRLSDLFGLGSSGDFSAGHRVNTGELGVEKLR